MSQKLKVNELKENPKNSYFFDDIDGDAWKEFLGSIKTSGVIEPIVVTSEKVIVSGHQRVRACKVLGIDEVEAEVKIYDSEDEVLKQLIETNIRQRGIGNANPVKFGRCLRELDRIYGVFRGNHSDENPNNLGSKTQEQIAKEIGISTETYRQYEKLSQSIPEIQSLVETGKVTKTVALSIMKQLSEDEQKQLAEEISKTDGRVSARQVEFYKNRIKTLTDENEELKQKPAEVKEVRVEVPPEDYETIKAMKASYEKENKMLMAAKTKDGDEIKKLKKRIADLESRADVTELQKKLETEAGYFAIRTYDYIQKNGGYVWITERLNNLQGDSRKQFIGAVYAIDAFAKQMIENIGGYGIE